MMFTIMFTMMFTMLTGQSWRRLSSSPGRSWIPPGPGSPRRTDGNLEKDGISIMWLSCLHQWHLLKVELVFCISYHIYTIGINGISLLQSFTGDGLFTQMLIWKDEIRNQSQNMKSSHIEPQLWKIFFHVPAISSSILYIPSASLRKYASPYYPYTKSRATSILRSQTSMWWSLHYRICCPKKQTGLIQFLACCPMNSWALNILLLPLLPSVSMISYTSVKWRASFAQEWTCCSFESFFAANEQCVHLYSVWIIR